MEPKAESRKTFRLDEASEKTLDKLKFLHGTENRAINHVLRRRPVEIGKQQEHILKLQGEVESALKDGRVWRAKFEAARDELQQIKSSLQLLGKLLNGTE